MHNKHQCVPQTRNRSEKFYATSIKQLLAKIYQNYSSQQGLFKTLPGLQTAGIMTKLLLIWILMAVQILQDTWPIFLVDIQEVLSDHEYLLICPDWELNSFCENLSISRRFDLNQWISSYMLEYSLDGPNWVRYKNSKVWRQFRVKRTIWTYTWTFCSQICQNLTTKSGYLILEAHFSYLFQSQLIKMICQAIVKTQQCLLDLK